MPDPFLPLAPDLAPAPLWAEIAARSRAWARERGFALRDCIVLLPFAALLAPARRAFAEAGGWLPRIDTAATLAASLGPPPPPEAGQISSDAAFDALLAAPLLRSQRVLADWPRRDRRGFDSAVRAVVQTAHALARAAAAVDPVRRADWWDAARGQLQPPGGDGGRPGGTERLLARIALEWAALAPAPATDALFGLRPAGWIVVQAGGPAPLIDAIAAGGAPCLRLDADAGLLPPRAAASRLCVAVCDGFEHEAQAAAACVLEHLNRGERPVALIAQDRVLVRRVRALLDRQQVPIADETGWRLATTRAAARVMTLLRAARFDASADDLLDWLKSGDAAAAGADRLEAELRRRSQVRVAAIDAAAMRDERAQAAWLAASRRLALLQGGGRRSLSGWLSALQAALDVGALQADAAGAQVVTALVAPPRSDDPPLDLAAFTAWVDATLEQASFEPPADGGEPAVVVTPLARAMLRPFAAVVLPGADAARLGAMPEPQPLLGDTLAQALGLPGVAARRDAERIAFAQLGRAPALTLLRRRHDGDEPLAPSPLLERLLLARREHGLPPPAVAVLPLGLRRVAIEPLARPLPAPRRVPAQLSASAVEALRDCPYRFHSRSVLGLREPDELDDEPEKRDYGTWLHEVLLRFHRSRVAGASAADEVERLHTIGAEVRDAQRLDAAAFVPFAASFERLAPLYVAWQRQRDAGGARFVDGEVERRARPAALGGVELKGRLDRIDAGPDGAPMLLDYKTGALAQLREKVREPLEDTQLAFYALLQAEAEPDADAAAPTADTAAAPVQAAYLALDAADKVHVVAHADVGASAAALLDGLAGELQRLRDGAPLPALGEGRVCETCEARGLCRRDDWS